MNDLRPFRFWCQKVLPLVYDDELSYYELLCKVVDYLNKTMENVNSLSENFNELQQMFNTLKQYVDDYFKNLDVQEEINNKLDNMANDGTLATLFGLYYTRCYNNVNEMIEDTYLKENMLARTKGYYTTGVGSCLYIITTNNNLAYSVKLKNGLYAMPCSSTLTSSQCGCSSENDNTELLTNVFNFCIKKQITFIVDNVIKISNTLIVPKELKIVFNSYFNVDNFNVTTQSGGWVFFEKPNYCVEPEMFGAKGDGISDDTKAIQNAIDSNLNPSVFPIGKTQTEVGKSHTNYNNICVKLSKTYSITNNLIIRAEQHYNELTIMSESMSKIIGNNCSGIAINKPDNYPSTDIDTQTNKSIIGITFTNCTYGIIDYGSDLNCYIKNCYFTNCNNGVKLSSTDGTILDNLYFSWINGYCIELYYSNRVRITNCTIGENDTTLGILVDNGSTAQNIISNNTLRTAVINIKNLSIGCIIDSNVFTKGGINIDDASRHVILSSNIFNACDTITLYKEHICKSNTFNNTKIKLKTVGNNISVNSNLFIGTDSGIIHESCLNCAIRDNTFINNVLSISANNSGFNVFIANNNFINCENVHNYISGETYNAYFAYNYSTQKNMVLGKELN